MHNILSPAAPEPAPFRAGPVWSGLARILDAQAAAGRALAPTMDAVLRLFVAQLLWRSGLAGLMHWQERLADVVPLARFAAMSPHSAAQLQTGLQLLLPALFALGLFVRPAAVVLGVASILAWQMTPSTPDIITTGILALWYFAAGAGPLSLDFLLGAGLSTSALPFAPLAPRAGRILAANLRPAAALAIRVVLAWTLLDAGVFPNALVACAAFLLAAGLFTRLATLPLIALAGFMAMHAMSNAHVGWILLLCLLAVSGPGALSLDFALGLIIRGRLRAWHEWQRARLGDLPHVVVVGGGFGGLAVARGLRHAPCRITIIDQRNYHLFQPLLYQVATASLSPADIATPIRAHFRDQANVRVLLGRVEGIDAGARRVVLQDGDAVPYDTLVLATGARHSYFGKDHWAESAPGLKTIEDATEIRGRLLLAFERAEAYSGPAMQDGLLTFAVVGGGPTGVELAGAVAELARHGLVREFRDIDPAQARVLLVHATDRLLPPFPPDLSAHALTSLQKLGVEVRLNSAVTDLDGGGLWLGEERVPCRTIFWAAGVAASPAARWLGAAADGAGRIKVAPDLSVPGFANVYAIGDTAAAVTQDGKPVPGLAPAAKQGGAYVARVIAAALMRRPGPGTFRYRHDGSLATIGRRAAVADFGRVRLSGALAWWFWGAVHILFLAGARNRLAVAVQWVWAYLTLARGIRLITRPRGGEVPPT